MHPYVHSSTIYNSQGLEAAHMPISRWVDKNHMVNLYSGILLRCKTKKKKKGNLTFCDSMDGPGEYI